MLNLHIKTSGIVALAAFLLSFVIGLIGRASFPLLLLRPLLFAALFFILTEGIYFVIARFLTGSEDAASGSHVDISVEDESLSDDAHEKALDGDFSSVPPVMASDATSSDDTSDAEVDENISVSPLHQSVPAADSAEIDDDISAYPLHRGAPAADNASLPDMDNMAGAFSENPEEEPPYEPPVRRTPDRAAAAALGKNIDPQKIAGALKTMLNRE